MIWLARLVFAVVATALGTLVAWPMCAAGGGVPLAMKVGPSAIVLTFVNLFRRYIRRRLAETPGRR